MLHAGVERPMAAGDRITGLFFIAPAFGLDDAKAHAAWSEFGRLP